jgi:hypothetical protein
MKAARAKGKRDQRLAAAMNIPGCQSRWGGGGQARWFAEAQRSSGNLPAIRFVMIWKK